MYGRGAGQALLQDAPAVERRDRGQQTNDGGLGQAQAFGQVTGPGIDMDPVGNQVIGAELGAPAGPNRGCSPPPAV